jgi:hypothetical protein
VHFPTDLNLLWDAGRKCVDLIEKYRDQFGYALPGWRKAKDWRRQLKNCERATSQTVYRGGAEQGGPRAARRARVSGRGPRAGGQGQRQPAGLCDQPWTGALGSPRIFSPDAGQAPGPGGAPVVAGRNHSGARESVFALRAAHRVDSRKASNARTWSWATGFWWPPTSTS